MYNSSMSGGKHSEQVVPVSSHRLGIRKEATRLIEAEVLACGALEIYQTTLHTGRASNPRDKTRVFVTVWER